MKSCITEKKLNTEKLFNSDFLNRLIGFCEEYDSLGNSNITQTIREWINNEDYSYIMHFLSIIPIKSIFPLSIHELISLNADDFIYWQEFYIRLSALLDEQKALYEEMLSLYE